MFGTVGGSITPAALYPNYATFPPSFSTIPSGTPYLNLITLPSPATLAWITKSVPPVIPSCVTNSIWKLSGNSSISNVNQSTSFSTDRNHPRVRYDVLSSTHTTKTTCAARPIMQAIQPFPINNNQGDFDWQMMAALFTNVTNLIANSVCAATQYTYRTGWKRWISYTATIGTDQYLQYIPPAFNQYVHQSHQAVQMSWAILACCGYLAYLISHPTKPTGAPTATKYLSAVRHNLRSFGLDIAFMDDSKFLSAARAGCIKGWQVLPGNSVSDRQTLPVSIAMLEQAKNKHLDLSILSHHGLYVANLCAYTLLCRVSEYLKRSHSNHHLRSESVVFWITHLNPADATVARPFLYVPSYDVWQYSLSRLRGVSVTIKDSKADQEGASDKYNFPRFMNPWPSTMAYEFSEELFNLAIRSKPLNGQPFFSCSTAERMTLSADIMNKFLKEKVAPMFDLNPKRVHTHSLRFAGASTLAAAKIEDSVIMKMGRWKSLAFLGYIRLAKEIFARVAAALADRSILTPADVRNLMPGL